MLLSKAVWSCSGVAWVVDVAVGVGPEVAACEVAIVLSMSICLFKTCLNGVELVEKDKVSAVCITVQQIFKISPRSSSDSR